MVKKAYTKPSMDEIKVDGMNLMAGSDCGEQGSGGGGASECEDDLGPAKSGQFDFSNTTSEDFDK